MSKGRKIPETPQEAFGIPEQTPNNIPEKGRPIILDKESQKALDISRGTIHQSQGMSIPNAGELFRLHGNKFIPDEQMDYTTTLAADQPFGEQVKNMALNSLPIFAAGFLDNYNYDIPEIAGLIAGAEQEYGNWLSELTKDLRSFADRPIYQQGDSLANSAYWLNMFQNQAYSTGLAAGALTEQLALSYVTAATGGAAAPLQAAKLASKGKLLKSALFGSFKGAHEGYINALETYEDTRQKYLDTGKYSAEEANKFASEAAALAYRMEVGPLMVLNALQFGVAGRATPFKKAGGSLNLGFSGTAEAATDVLFKGVKHKGVREGLSLATQLGSESLEEIIQTGVSKYAQHKTMKESKDVFTDFTFWDNEMRDSAIGGALGGGMFYGLGKLSNIGGKNLEKQLLGKATDDFINNMGTRIGKNLKEFQKAQQEGDQRKMDTLRFKMQRDNVFESLQLDYMNQNENSFNAYVDTLNKTLEAIQNQDLETLKTLGLTTQEDIDHALTTFPKLIEDAVSIKDKFTTAYAKTGDFAVASTIADSQQVLQNYSEFIERNNNEIARLPLEDPILKSLSQSQKEYVALHSERVAMGSMEEISPKQYKRYKEIEERLAEINEEVWETEDIDIINNFDLTDLAQLHFDNLNLERVKVEASNRINEWSRPEKIAEIKKERAAEAIKKAKTKEELVEAKKKLDDQNIKDPALTEVVNDKIEKAEVKEASGTPVQAEVAFEVKDDGTADLAKQGQAKEIADLGNLAELEEAQNGNTKPLDESPYDEFYQPSEMPNLSAELKAKLADKVKAYMESMKEGTTFVEFVRDFIKNNSKENADRIYNALAAGWETAGFAETNFKQAYSDIFQDKKDIALAMVGLAEDAMIIVDDVEDAEQSKQDNIGFLEAANAHSAKTVEINQETNQSETKDVTVFKAVSPNLRAGHLSIAYNTRIVQDENGTVRIIKEDVGEGLANTTDINSQKLLNPNEYHPGTRLKVRVPKNYKDMKVQVWEDAITKKGTMTFGQWMEANNIQEGSPEWWDKVPMIAFDSEGDGVFFIHDTDWYSPLNIGMEHDPVKQGKIIQEAKTTLRDFRGKLKGEGKVTEREIEIEITEKRPGMLKPIPESQDPITINQANPQSMMGIINAHGQVVLNGKEIFENDERKLINTKRDFQEGHAVQIRQVGKGKYIALKVLRGRLDAPTQSTLFNIIQNYVNTYEEGVDQNMRDNYLKITGLDMLDKDDIAPIVKLFSMVSYKKGDHNRVMAHIKSRVWPSIKDGDSFIFFNGNAIVFGIKGQKINGKDYERVYPEEKNQNDKKYQAELQAALKALKNEVLPKLKPNMSKKALEDDRAMANIDEEGNVTPGKKYREYIKDTFTTNIQSFNVGTQKEPIYATMIQPVIEYKAVGEPVDVANPSTTTIKEIKDKEEKGEPLTEQQTGIKQSANEEFTPNPNEELIGTLKDTMQSLLELGVLPSDPAILDIQKQLEDLGDSFDSPYPVTQGEIQKMKEEVGDNVPGLTIRQNFQVVDYIFNEISKKLDFKYGAKIDKKEALGSIKKSYMEMIGSKQKRSQEVLANLKKVAATNPGVEGLITRMETEMEVFNTIKTNWSTLEGFAMAKIRKFTGIKESKLDIEVEIIEDQGLTVKNYSKSALEEGGKTTSSYRLKRFLAGIKDIAPDGTVRTGFLGVPLYIGFDKAYATLESVLSSPQAVESDFYAIIARLEENIPAYPWLRQVVEQLKTADGQIQNELVYNFTRHTLSMKFVMFSKNRNGNYTLKVYDTNSTEITRVIRDSWNNNFIASPNNLVFPENGVHKLNKERAKILLDKFDSWKDKISAPKAGDKGRVEVSNTELLEWLEEFGIMLSKETINEMRNKEVTYLTQDGKTKMAFSQLFKKQENSDGIFGLLANYLATMIELDDTTIDDNNQNHPFNNANNVLKTLSRIESKYSLNATTNTFRDGGKSIYGFTPTKFATDQVNRLKFHNEKGKNSKDTNPYRDALKQKSFSKHSFYLRLLEESGNFRGKLYADHIGITALKELGKRVFGDQSITKLSDADHELTKLGLFQDNEQGDLKEYFDAAKTIPLRMARMFFPTMSDKSQMLSLYTAVLALKDKHFDVVNGTVAMKDQIKEALYSQLVLPELERLTNYMDKIAAKGTNIKGYDFAAQMFLAIPELNNLVDPTTGKSVLSLMINEPGTYNKAWFEENMKEQALEVITGLVNNEVTNKMAEWRDSGFTEVNEKGETVTQFMNEKYLNGFRGTTSEKVKMAAHDYVINSLIANANINMVIAGDIAVYSQNKIKKYFQNGKPYLPKPEYGKSAYALAAKEVSTNVGKRLALLLAPGSKLANSIGETYSQIFLNDQFSATLNIDYLAGLYEKYKVTDADKEVINKYNEHLSLNTEMPKALEDKFKALKRKFPNIAPYFSIEATDAQEYTTVKEHVDILWRQGRLHSSQHEAILDKINSGEDFNAEELELILQPIKPVHTGFKDDPEFDVMRMMYIKTSSFPLIPQITKGSEIDKVRELLEKRERDTGMSVRASFASGNKVGGIANSLPIYNQDGTFNTNLTEQEVVNSTLILDRDNFRIQQDVPFKSLKNKADKVSLGTQTLKLLFGDGMLDINDFEFNGETVTGKDLAQRFADNFNAYTNLKKNMLFKELGMDKEGNPIDTEKTMLKLQEMLRREAEDRGYPRQDIEALNLTMVTNLKDEKGFTVALPIERVKKLKSGKLTTVEIEELKKEVGEKAFKALQEGTYEAQDVQFTLPLWMSPNSNRYESLLNAIVTNRLVKAKMPGSAYVLGSEGGFKFQKDMKGVDKSKVIYLDNYEGELRPVEYDEDGNLKKAQIMVPSKFRDNQGNLINLLTDKDQEGNLKYVYRDDEGVLRLRPGKIDPSLLNITSFRIPTSGHVSMSQVDIVGILPPEVGDLMIVPKNFSVQKGLDYDVDKETTYHLHTFTDADGNIRPFDEEARQEILKQEEQWGDTPEDKLLSAIFGADVDFDLSDLEPGEKLDLINDKLQQKIHENEFIKIHASVLSNPNPEVQKKINKVLSMEFATSQAEMVQQEVDSNVDNTYFTMLSETYQKNKMALGASGKLGIGVYSNYVVFHSMVQQSSKPIQLKTKDEEGSIVPVRIQIGSQISTGELGRTTSLAPLEIQRSIAEVFAERQNTATDNEKEQIMGRLNINGFTINVDSILSALGFDKDSWEISKEEFDKNDAGAYEKNGKYYRVGSLSYLLLSQPIIMEYVAEMNKTQSSTQEYDVFAEDRIVEKLFKDYTSETEVNEAQMPSMLTGKELFKNLTKPNPAIQTEVLRVFIELNEYGKQASKLQSRMNINDSGLGKSFFETIEKYEGVQNVIKEIDYNKRGFMISNASSLIGDYRKMSAELSQNTESELTKKGFKYNIYKQMYEGSSYDLSLTAHNDMTLNGFDKVDGGYVHRASAELIEEGYVPFDRYLIKPTTPVGTMLVNAVATGYDLWNTHFPYDNPHIAAVTKEILDDITDESTSGTKMIERRQHIFQEMKKYFVTSERLGTFVGDPQAERYRLFMDKGPDKKSLANYLRGLMRDKGAVYEILKSNNLLSRFNFEISKNGVPSLIKFDNTKGENFDEDYMYMALIELMESNQPLPAFNGQEYTTKDLAQDLIAYNYLEGGIQQAIQFTKYVPVSYLNTIPFGKFLREWGDKSKPDIFYGILGRSRGKGVSRFARQYFQNNPGRLPKIDALRHINKESVVFHGTKKTIDNLLSFEIDAEILSDAEVEALNSNKFVTIYNPDAKKGTKKFLVFEKDGDHFRRISSLGVFGMNEYSMKSDDVESIVNDSYLNPAPAQAPTNPKRKTTAGDFFFLRNGTTQDILEALKTADYIDHPHLKPLFNALLPFIGDVKIELRDLGGIARGRYIRSENTIVVDKDYYAKYDKEDIAQTLVHEITHALTVHYLSKWVDGQGKIKEGVDPNSVPKEITELIMLFNETRRKLGPEWKAYVEKRAKQKAGTTTEGTTERERTVAYAGYNIFEFVAISLTEPNFQKEMKDTKYKESADSIFDRLARIVKDILVKIVGDTLVPGTITTDSVRVALELVKAQANMKKPLPTQAQIDAKQNAEDQKLAGDDNELIFTLDSPGENSTFVIPFNCK